MDDPILFNQFLNEVAGFRDVNARVAILTFVRTFQALLTVSEEDIERFAKDTHAANGGLPIADRIVLPAGAIISLQAVHFEFRDRQRCNALPTRAMIQNLDADQVDILRTARSDAIERRQIMKDQSNNLTDMTIPKLTTMNYDKFFTAFSTLTERVMSAFDIPLSYILRTTPPGNYDAVYVTRELKLKNCLIMTGPLFQSDSQLLYSLFVQHIGTTGIGSTVVNAHKNTRNGRQCFLELNQHFRNQSYLDNKAAKAEKAIQNAVYHGTRRNFTLETYSTIMTNAFNDLEQAGPAHYLSDDQRVTKFENGLHQKDAVNYAIIAKQEWICLPLATRTFDQYYNIFSAYMGRLNVMHNDGNANRRIGNMTTDNAGRGGRGRGGRNGRGRGRGRGRDGRGRGCGRGYVPYNTPTIAPRYGQQELEAKVYPPSVYRQFTHQQKKEIAHIKNRAGWINPNTPPPGFVIDDNTGYAVPNNNMVHAVAASISRMNTNGPAPSLPPPTNNNDPPIPPNVSTTSTAGSHFGRSGQRQQPSDTSTVSMVSVNGRPYNGPIFDQHGNQIN